MSTQDALKQLTSGTAKVLSEKELTEKLELGRPLRVKLGVDPTAPDIHLGHTVAIEKLRQFQELGHTAVLIIGDFTATVGVMKFSQMLKPTQIKRSKFSTLRRLK